MKTKPTEIKPVVWALHENEEIARLREAGEKLEAALSQIDYLCGPPNDMNVAGYDVHCCEDAVVRRVRRLREALESLLDAADRAMHGQPLSSEEWYAVRDAARAITVGK
jgi:hypothetical protein